MTAAFAAMQDSRADCSNPRPVLARGLLGYTDGRRITLRLGHASHVEFATLAHETSHVLLHFPDGRTMRTCSPFHHGPISTVTDPEP